MSKQSKVHHGLKPMNSDELPLWVNNILRYLAYEHVKSHQREREMNTQQEIDNMSWWQKFIHGFPTVNYAPLFFMQNPFPTPSAADLEKFQEEYPDMYKEWAKGV